MSKQRRARPKEGVQNSIQACVLAEQFAHGEVFGRMSSLERFSDAFYPFDGPLAVFGRTHARAPCRPCKIVFLSFAFALNYLVDHELNLSALDAQFNNDEAGASALAR
jgi:hypothetical protein